MRTLRWYLLRQTLATLGMTVLVFTFILLLGESLKEIFALLVNGQVGAWTLAQAVGLLVPFVLVFALPMGLLTAMLLVMGRFSADQELTAARACGISLVALVSPLIALSILCAGLCAAINLEWAPDCRAAYKRLLYQAGADQMGAWLRERVFIRDFPDYILYAGKVEGMKMEDVRIYRLDSEGQKRSYLWASEGKVELDRTNRQVTFTLFDGRELVKDTGLEPAWHSFGELQVPPLKLPAQFAEKPRLSNMSFRQLGRELAEVEAALQANAPAGKFTSEELRAKLRELAVASEALTEPIRLQMHRQASFSFACVGFALVGIPLGIRAHRRETSAGFALSLVLVVVYYSFFILAQSLEARPELYPHLLVWAPNILFQTIGVLLLWRSNRRG
ncbi:MAG: LptF/LptG family permease [Verrucomicrobia bacterium]|nr:LptF/LptG family permease [Verrucomicrobiota bacterium]